MRTFPALALLAALALAGCEPVEDHAAADAGPSAAAAPTAAPTLPPGELGKAVQLGEHIVRETGTYAKAYVGNRLSCASCHIDAGRKPNAAAFTGVYAAYPQYRARSGEVTTLEDRVDECFQRSMNGKPLPHDGKEMRALIAYMAWTSKGVSVGTSPASLGIAKLKRPAAPDPAHGKQAYATSCAICHGVDGQGIATIPPLWGSQSFNIGAGMARLDTAAAFIKWNMPKGKEGTLSDAEAYDIAAFVLGHPRPDFPGKRLDWPKGGKPADTPY